MAYSDLSFGRHGLVRTVSSLFLFSRFVVMSFLSWRERDMRYCTYCIVSSVLYVSIASDLGGGDDTKVFPKKL